MYQGDIMDLNTMKTNEQIVLAIALKYNQLKRDYLENLEVDQLVKFLFEFKWKRNIPESTAKAVIEIMDVKAETIVAYLSQIVVVESKNKNLSDFNDLFAKGVR